MPLPTHHPIYQFVGQQLRKLRADRNLTQAQVAKVLGVSAQQYQKYEDAQSRATIAVVVVLANYYGISISDILDGTPLPDVSPQPHPVVAPASSDEEEVLLMRLFAAYSKLSSPQEKRQLVDVAESKSAAGMPHPVKAPAA